MRTYHLLLLVAVGVQASNSGLGAAPAPEEDIEGVNWIPEAEWTAGAPEEEVRNLMGSSYSYDSYGSDGSYGDDTNDSECDCTALGSRCRMSVAAAAPGEPRKSVVCGEEPACTRFVECCSPDEHSLERSRRFCAADTASMSTNNDDGSCFAQHLRHALEQHSQLFWWHAVL